MTGDAAASAGATETIAFDARSSAQDPSSDQKAASRRDAGADEDPGLDPGAVRFDAAGLVPAIVQDDRTGDVLMLGWMDREALDRTIDTREVHFWSRSRQRLWRKGETSGNVLAVASVARDCDGDALLVRARPSGPTCHRGTVSCFDPDPAAATGPDRVGESARRQGFADLERLWETIAERARSRPAGSYTARLVDGGVDAAGRKVTEEATEVLIAAKDDATAQSAGSARDGTRTALAAETADLLFHAFVLLAERGLEPRDVLEVLATRRR